ncbi:hypothetical protein A0256_15355 [Mucilaginibacter sp. PAMC 26640]|nr:hypothetical protein A0256_15355 [Mucilaginibacter sp. PAMC 26640]
MLNYLKSILDHRGPYPARIRERHQQFWNDPNAEHIRNTIMDAEDSIDEWKNVDHWQRKLSNKHNAREFAGKFGCKVASLIWEGRNVDEINFNSLPKHYVIRPTIGHSSNHVFIMKDGYNLFDKKRYQPKEILAILKQQVAANKHIHFLVEEFLQNEQGATEILKDYKIFCFNGEIACIWVIDRLSPTSGTACFYDSNWNLIKPINKKYLCGKYQAPPACLNDMLDQAKRLSKAYEIFVRVDFYATNNGAVFGEFTPTPSMGGNTTRFGQKLLMNYWNKYCAGMI